MAKLIDNTFPVKVFYNQWIWFTDSNGPGYAEPDIYFQTGERTYLFEVKLTETPVAISQMEQLYKPLLEFIYDKPVVCCQVFKNVKSAPKAETLLNSVKEILGKSEDQIYTYIHI